MIGEQRAARAAERSDLLARQKEAQLQRDHQKQQTRTLFEKHDTPLPLPNKFTLSVSKTNSALAEKKRLQAEFKRATEKANAKNLTGTLTDSRHKLLNLYIAFVLLLELERAKLAAECAMRESELKKARTTYNKQAATTRQLFKRNNKPLPDHLTVRKKQSGISSAIPNDGYDNVVNQLESRAIAEEEAKQAKKAAAKQLRLETTEHDARGAMDKAMQSRTIPGLTGNLTTC